MADFLDAVENLIAEINQTFAYYDMPTPTALVWDDNRDVSKVITQLRAESGNYLHTTNKMPAQIYGVELWYVPKSTFEESKKR